MAVVSGQQWIMVFRGASGDIGGANNIFTLWNNLGTSGENVPCANSVGSRCSTHYKNKLVDDWNKMIIHKVNKRGHNCVNLMILALYNKLMHLPLLSLRKKLYYFKMVFVEINFTKTVI